MPKPHLIGKSVLVVIGIIELVMLILGKAYCVPTKQEDPSVMFENQAVVEEIQEDSINILENQDQSK